ncbi:MAG: thiamine pyrophosphate-binding protein [Trueperaceae bacterium]|jgi:acetolactate synthase-1/2/3 large subunit|nr:thiamine pyrophosphate-binding protein [Trueperaceae bacterium]
MALMTGGQALARQLHREGIRVIFGLPGVQLYHALDGLHGEEEIRFINTRHEQATTYMADGYARAGGDIGTALVVPGPGLQNASAGIGTAYATSSPVLVLAGQVEKELIGVDRGVLHEVNDQLDIVKPVTKWARRVLEADEIPTAVHEAFQQLKTGRPRPVEIEIPPETLAKQTDTQLLGPAEIERPGGDPKKVEQAVEVLAASSKPLIWAGGGAVSSGTSHILAQLSEFLQAPVLLTPEGKGALSERHDMCLGAARLPPEFIAAHDVVIAVGTRLSTPGMLSNQRVIQVDIDPAEIGRNYTNTLGVTGDACLTLELMFELLKGRHEPKPKRLAEIVALKTELFDSTKTVEPLGAFLRAIRSAMPDDGILVPGMTQVGYYARRFFPAYQPRTYLTSSYFGNLGFAYPTALGAKVACPEKAVVAVSGDGGFLFNSQELATAVRHKIGTVVIVFNDNAYGNVLRDQKTRFDGRTYGSNLHNPDFVLLAKAYGATGIRVEDEDANKLEAVLIEAIERDEPTLIEVPVGEMPYPY